MPFRKYAQKGIIFQDEVFTHQLRLKGDGECCMLDTHHFWEMCKDLYIESGFHNPVTILTIGGESGDRVIEWNGKVDNKRGH